MLPRRPTDSTTARAPSLASASTCTCARLSVNHRGWTRVCETGLVVMLAPLGSTPRWSYLYLQDGAMSNAKELAPFSHVILALVGRGGAGPHDIVRMMRQGAQFWSTSESHYYAEPKRLAKLGYLSARTEPGRTRPRTHYELTDEGVEALRAWLAEPAAMPRVQHEGIVKLLAAPLGVAATGAA